jgi:DNA polymerase III alpha subunit (gram-positive type)
MANLMPMGSPRVSEPVYQDQRRLADVTLLAFDTETPGLFPIMHRLVEIGAVRFRLDGRQLATFQTCVDPAVPISAEAPPVQGLTATLVAGPPRIAPAWPRLLPPRVGGRRAPPPLPLDGTPPAGLCGAMAGSPGGAGALLPG